MPKKESQQLSEIKQKLLEIDQKLNQLLQLQRRAKRGTTVPDTLSSLPEHLRITASNIAMIGEATAEQVAERTGRARAAESDYLNQLASRKFLKKQRKGREIYFRVFALYTICSNCGARVLMTLERCAICGALLKQGKI